MDVPQLTAAGVPVEHHATAQAAMGAGFDIGVLIQLATTYGPVIWSLIQEVLRIGGPVLAEVQAFIAAGKFDMPTVLAELAKVLALMKP